MPTSLTDFLPMVARIGAERTARQSLTGLATSVGRSPAHFQRTFARVAGESPTQLDRRLRLERAAALLLTTPRSVLDIALDVGFASHEGFTRAFCAQFGRSPRAFRTHGVARAHQARHAALVTHVGPCLRFYRAGTADVPPGSRSDTSMSYDIVQKTIDPQPFLFRSTRCPRAELGTVLAELLPSVFQYATGAGIAMAGPPLVRYLTWGPAMTTIEAGLPVVAGAPGKGDIQGGTLPGGRVATTVHTGPYEGLIDAYGALERWIDEQGLEPGGAPWEVYLTDPGEVPDPAQWKTEVFWPLG